MKRNPSLMEILAVIMSLVGLVIKTRKETLLDQVIVTIENTADQTCINMKIITVVNTSLLLSTPVEPMVVAFMIYCLFLAYLHRKIEDSLNPTTPKSLEKRLHTPPQC